MEAPCLLFSPWQRNLSPRNHSYSVTFCLLFSASSGRKKGSRKRKLVVDHSKELSNEAIKAQLADSSDLLTPLDIAPPTRQLMDWKENGGVDYLFSHFCTPVMNKDLQQVAHTTHTGFMVFWRFHQKYIYRFAYPLQTLNTLVISLRHVGDRWSL